MFLQSKPRADVKDGRVKRSDANAVCCACTRMVKAAALGGRNDKSRVTDAHRNVTR